MVSGLKVAGVLDASGLTVIRTLLTRICVPTVVGWRRRPQRTATSASWPARATLVVPQGPSGQVQWPFMRIASVAREPAVRDPVRPRRVGAETFDLVLLVGTEVAFEPEPLGLVVVVAFPGEDVRA